MNLNKILSLIRSAMCSHMTHYGVEAETLYLNNADWRVLRAAWLRHPYCGNPPQLELFDDYIPPNTRFYGMVVEAHPTESYLAHRVHLSNGYSLYTETTEFALT